MYPEAYEKALAGDCGPLLERLDRPETRSIALAVQHAVRGALHDMGLCLRFDPRAAYRAFREADDVADAPFLLAIAWKLWHGHGVARDRAAAIASIRDWLIFIMSIGMGEFRSASEVALLYRDPPPPLRRGTAWAESLQASPGPVRAAFALDLIKGEARDWRGETFSAEPERARSILRWAAESYPRAYYDYGIAAVRGELPGVSVKAGEDALRRAARQCVEPSFRALADYYGHGPGASDLNQDVAFYWLRVARAAGNDVNGRIARFEAKLKPWERDLGWELANARSLPECLNQ